MTTYEAPVDLHDAGTFASGIPHEAFAEMRSNSGLAWTPADERAGDGFWSVTRFDDLVKVSRDTGLFSSAVGHIQIYDIDPDALEARASMIDLDPPIHTRLRRLVSAAFTPRHVQSYQDAARRRVRVCLDQLTTRGSADWVRTVAAPIPIGVICDLMGVPEEDHGYMIELSDHLVAGTSNEPLEPTAYGNTTELRLLPFNSPAAHGMAEYARQLGQLRRSEPTDDLVTRLIEAEVDGERLTDAEFTNFFRLMIFAGNETTRSAMAHLALHLRQFDEVFELVASQRALVPALVDEVIRYSSPILYFRRTVTAATELSGTPLKVGDKVVMWYAAANFDQTVFDAPLEFRVDRPPMPGHVAFGGGGAHFCLGASLARLELAILVEELLDRRLQLDVGSPEFVESNFVNGIEVAAGEGAMIRDEWGEPVAVGHSASVDAWNRAWNTALHFKDDPFAELASANTDDAEFALGQVFCAAYLVLSGAPPDSPELVSGSATARARAGDSDRERGHTDAVELLAAGEFTAAARTWDRMAEGTRDLAAVRFAHDVYLHVGDNDGRLASSTAALSNWSPSDPGYGFVLGQHAFSLEEAGRLDEAEAVGWSALEQDPEDIWALHALAHVFETGNDQRASLELLQSRQDSWSQHDSLAVHLWWHLALRVIAGGRTEQALAIHDRLLADATTAFRLCDLASLLWRLELCGVDVGDRWLPLADRWAGRRERHTCAFLDLHAALVFLRVPQHPESAGFLAGLVRAHTDDTSENGAIFRDVLRPLLDGFRAVASGQPDIGGTLFRTVADTTHRIGGSNAQRELITMTEQSLARRSSD